METINSIEQLRALFGYAKGRAKEKILSKLEPQSVHFIEQSPMVFLSTSDGNQQMDCSPRGGEPGFVKIINNQQLLIPEVKGNNLLDSLSNIIKYPKAGCLFVIPGVDETLRVNGNARISIDEEHLSLFKFKGKAPRAAIVIDIDRVYLHCAKAFMRSELWKKGGQFDRKNFPTMAQMMSAQLNLEGEVESQEDMIKRYKPDL